MLGKVRPTGGLRLLLRLPVWLYRFHLGWALGHRFLLLTHRGRRTGRIHRTVLEVVRYAPETDERVVVAAWGNRADWYRNLQAESALETRTGRRRYKPEQRFLSDDQLRQLLAEYQREHRVAAHVIGKLFGLRWGDSATGLPTVEQRFRAVAFRPASRGDGTQGSRSGCKLWHILTSCSPAAALTPGIPPIYP